MNFFLRQQRALSQSEQTYLEDLAGLSRTQLLLALNDTNPTLRQSIVKYWDQEHHLERQPVSYYCKGRA